MHVVHFHEHLMREKPSREALEFYESGARGFSVTQVYPDKLLATFVLGLFLTYDRDNSSVRKVAFAVPWELDGDVIDGINSILMTIRERRKAIPKDRRTAGTRKIADAVGRIEIGHRVFSISQEPAHWVSYGFVKGGNIPEWLERGLKESKP